MILDDYFLFFLFWNSPWTLSPGDTNMCTTSGSCVGVFCWWFPFLFYFVLVFFLLRGNWGLYSVFKINFQFIALYFVSMCWTEFTCYKIVSWVGNWSTRLKSHCAHTVLILVCFCRRCTRGRPGCCGSSDWLQAPWWLSLFVPDSQWAEVSGSRVRCLSNSQTLTLHILFTVFFSYLIYKKTYVYILWMYVLLRGGVPFSL